MIFILLNTFCLALDRYPVASELEIEILSKMNIGFTVIFTFECVVKLIGLGLTEFRQDSFNIFDLVIVTVSIIQIVLKQFGMSHSKIFSVLRTFRVFRIFKLFKIGELRLLLDSIAFTVSEIWSYACLLSFFMYIFALIGMSTFAGQIKFDSEGDLNLETGEPPRENFDSLSGALLTIFDVLIGDDWTGIMFNCIRAKGEAVSIYFILLVIMGTIILMNLFLAIMLGNFDKARCFGQKRQVLDAFYELMHINEGSRIEIDWACDIILDDLSDHVKYKVLKLYNWKAGEK